MTYISHLPSRNSNPYRYKFLGKTEQMIAAVSSLIKVGESISLRISKCETLVLTQKNHISKLKFHTFCICSTHSFLSFPILLGPLSTSFAVFFSNTFYMFISSYVVSVIL